MRGKPVMGRVALAGVLALGFAALWGMAGVWLVESGLFGAREPLADEQLGFLDGRPVVARYTFPPGQWRFRDLEGRPLETAGGPHPPLISPVTLPALLPERVGWAERGWGQRLRRFDVGGWPPEVWFLVTDGKAAGSAWLAGYDIQTQAPLGVLGREGLRPGEATQGPPPAERVPFAGAVTGWNSRVLTAGGVQVHPQAALARARQPGEGQERRGSVTPWDVYLLGRDGRLYHADLSRRTLAVARDEPDTRSLAVTAALEQSGREPFVALVVRSDEVLRLLDAGGKELVRYPIPEELHGRTLGFLGANADEAVMTGFGRAAPDEQETTVRLFRVRPDGTVREQPVRLARSHSAVERRTWQASGLLIPSPLLYAAVLAGRAAETSTGRDDLAVAVRQVVASSWLPLGTVLAIGVVLAVLCWRRQVRYGATGAALWAWPVFVLLLGLPGWVGYRYGRRWPVLAQCPSCGGEAPRDREQCARCRAEFPGPALRGTEVFA